ncbi:(2Fe-2S)-binding protein [Ferrimonas aestuarii]|uniref:(2Fe-2S)-binding protein n=1 Tax=Ferrimonas aestuarii TaxID=2569539 RepID=A0A4U1BRC4_9GAMM|nr:(2Fe-2S)-binding protein [Ferrimonas aestuarii]TKB55474.1 (2Fe-2S)-binding protein [Ferrimonas aestuarii]
MEITLTVNGKPHKVEAPSDIPLLWALRDHLQLTGTKYGCGKAQCGACTVIVDGKAVRSCTRKAKSVVGKSITTIESGAPTPETQALRAAWTELNVHQCGYCQPGQIMAASALLMSNANPDDAAIDKAMSGVICRCATYHRIRKGIKQAAKTLPQFSGTQPAQQGGDDVA